MNDRNRHTMNFVLAGLASGWLVFGLMYIVLASYLFICVKFDVCL